MSRSGLFGTGGDAVALLGVDVRAEVVAGHACAVVRQRYRNDAQKAIEAVYTFPLPTKAVLTGFSMTVEGRRLEGEVREREEAFRRYDDAITAGHGGALLEQERPNVFTANVGNLLPGEETIIEVQYVEPVVADEGAVRWSIPTLVAPRYMPGTPSGADRTAHGSADPTTSVPDADRISPPIAGVVSYGLALDLTFDLGVALEVESPSHSVVIRHEGDNSNKTHVTFSQREVPLDRDVVVTAFAKSSTFKAAPIASAVTHRVKSSGKPGAFALTLVPDLAAGLAKRVAHSEVVFVLDRSGSMGGPSMTEARTALRLCLRQLREGDRFNILAFDDTIEPFSPQMVPFTQATLQRADAWLAKVDARGGTELLKPMFDAIMLAPDGVIVLLTDGQVGNEDEILAALMRVRKSARIYSFGIGTNVADALLQTLGDQTGGAVEMIHPGERVDEKVVAQFARATAPRVTDVTIKTRGIELGEIAPAEARPLVDAEPYSVFATYEEAGRGVVEIRGKLDGEAFFLEVPVDLAEDNDRPVIAKLWAQARIRDLERAVVTGRRADSMKDRIVKLATENGVSSKYTSFVVIEKRTGDRRMSGQPDTRVVPVNAPADWDMFQMTPPTHGRGIGRPMMGGGAPSYSLGRSPAPAVRPCAMPAPSMMRGYAAAPPPAPPAPPAGRAFSGGPVFDAPPPLNAFGGSGSGSGNARDAERDTGAAPPMGIADYLEADGAADPDASMPVMAGMPASVKDTVGSARKGRGGDPVLEILARQAASGLWEQSGGGPSRDIVVVTVDALLSLLRLGITSSHMIYGAQVKKAVEALLTYVQATRIEPKVLELALGIAWLLASGRRTRHTIEDTVRGSTDLAALSATLGNEPAVRAHVDALCALHT